MIETFVALKFAMLSLMLLMSAFFSGTETALLSIASGEIAKLKESCGKGSRLISMWEQQPALVLTSIVLGNNIVNSASGVIAASIVMDLSQHSIFFRWFFIPAVTAAILFFCEILPKVYSRYNAEKACSYGVGFMKMIADVITPVSVLFIKLSERILKVLGVALTSESPYLNSKELKTLLDAYSSQQGAIAAPQSAQDGIPHKESRMMRNILGFIDQKVEQVMVPRGQMFAVDVNQDMDALISKVLMSKYSRVPVYGKTLDNITGIIYAKDLIAMKDNKELLLLDDLIRQAYFVPENTPINNLLREFKKGHQHMAIVVDEYGATAGLITIEDLVEEIVGEIYDEYDIKEKRIIYMPENSWIIFGDEAIKSVNEEVKLNLYYPDVVTVNGMIVAKAGRIPQAGETLNIDNLKIEIMESDRKKVKKIRLTKQP